MTALEHRVFLALAMGPSGPAGGAKLNKAYGTYLGRFVHAFFEVCSGRNDRCMAVST